MKSPTPVSFFLRAAALWVLVSLPFVVAYVITDPMRVIRWHSDMMPGGFIGNKGSVSAIQLAHNAPTEKYNSFILGSSLAINFHTEEWKKYLPDDAVPYHFDSSIMNIDQLEQSLRFITRHCEIKNVLIIWDKDDTWTPPREESQFATAPQIAATPTRCFFSNWTLFSAWYSRGYLNGWICSMIGARAKGVNYYPHFDDLTYIPRTNEEQNPHKDDSLKVLSDKFLAAHPDLSDYFIPYFRNTTQISPRAREVVTRIADLLNSSGADYRFVIVPNRDHLIPSTDDDNFLRATFGDRYVLTQPELGYLTVNPYYYFDSYHFRPEMASIIVKHIYSSHAAAPK